MTTKTKHQSLEAIARALTPGSISNIPIDTLTKEEFQQIIAPDPKQRFLDLEHIGTNRDMILEGVGLLDVALTELLRRFVVPDAAEKLFSAHGKIKDLEAKIELSFGLGLIDAEERAYLNALRRIRNAFAHDPTLHHFEHDEKVVGLIRSIPPKFQGAPFHVSTRRHLCTLMFGIYISLEHRVSVAMAEQRVPYKSLNVEDANR